MDWIVLGFPLIVIAVPVIALLRAGFHAVLRRREWTRVARALGLEIEQSLTHFSLEGSIDGAEIVMNQRTVHRYKQLPLVYNRIAARWTSLGVLESGYRASALETTALADDALDDVTVDGEWVVQSTGVEIAPSEIESLLRKLVLRARIECERNATHRPDTAEAEAEEEAKGEEQKPDAEEEAQTEAEANAEAEAATDADSEALARPRIPPYKR